MTTVYIAVGVFWVLAGVGIFLWRRRLRAVVRRRVKAQVLRAMVAQEIADSGPLSLYDLEHRYRMRRDYGVSDDPFTYGG